MSDSISRISCIALNTFRELVRSKVLYAVILFAIVVIAVSGLFGSVTIGDQVLVLKDFGLFSISLFTVAFAVIAGAALLHKELSKKTIYNILSKPVFRAEFLWGKFIGMLATVALMIGLMGIGLAGLCAFLEQTVDPYLAFAFAGIFLEAMVICAAAIFFSSIVVTPVLIGLFSFGIFLAGRSTGYLLYFINEGTVSGIVANLLKGVYTVLPHLDRINLSSAVVYRNLEALSSERLWWASVYTLAYSIILMVLAGMLFRRREFN